MPRVWLRSRAKNLGEWRLTGVMYWTYGSANMPRKSSVWTLLCASCALLLTGCASTPPMPQPVVVTPPQIPPRPAVCEQQSSPSYSERLRQRLHEWQRRLIELQQM